MKTVIAMIAMMLACISQAGTFFVSLGGSDSNPGTRKAPFRTLRKGLSVLRAGDQLQVRGGTYAETLKLSLTPGEPGKRVWVRAYPGERPILKGLLWLTRPSYWTFDGINVTWPEGESSRSHMVKITNGVGWTFKNCDLGYAKSYANLLVAGTVAKEPRQWKVYNNVIHDVAKSNDTNQDHAIYCNTGKDSGAGTIERNLIYNVANGNGVKVAGNDPGTGSRNVTVRYNTIVNCTQGVLIGWASSGTRVYRNIIVQTAKGYGAIRGFELTGKNNVASDNVYWDCAGGGILNYNAGNGVTDGGGNIEQDPRLDALFKPTIAIPYGRDAPLPVPNL